MKKAISKSASGRSLKVSLTHHLDPKRKTLAKASAYLFTEREGFEPSVGY